jgi:hypothetical protein
MTAITIMNNRNTSSVRSMRRNVLTLGAIILITLAANVPRCVTASYILYSGLHVRTSISLKISASRLKTFLLIDLTDDVFLLFIIVIAVMSFWLNILLWCCTIRIMRTEYTIVIKAIITKTGISSTSTKLNFAVVDTLHKLGPSVKSYPKCIIVYK